jgi:D-arabinose 1-dehydrogenase-like Zn-dependent alcohol dehydrogenase
MEKRMMKAARLYKIGEPFHIEEIPLPEVGLGEVLVQVKFCGICGSDLQRVAGVTRTAYLPITLGHEISGEVAAVSKEINNWKVGERVTFSGVLNCGFCYNCLNGKDYICENRRFIGIHADGGFAQFVKVKADKLVRLPLGVSFEEGALVEPVGSPFHALTRRAKLIPGETVAVYGAGGIGVFTICLAKLCGAAKVIAVDIKEEVLERAKVFGADQVINAAREDPIRRIKQIIPRGVDLAVECVGTREAVANSVKSLRMGGRAVVVGLGSEEIKIVPPTTFVRSEFELIGSYAYSTAELGQIVNLISEGRLDISAAVSEKNSLDRINEAFDRFRKKIGNPIRILVSPE